MPKKNQTQPFRMTFAFEGGPKGTRTFGSEQDALDAAAKQAQVVSPDGRRCTVVVSDRRQHEES